MNLKVLCYPAILLLLASCAPIVAATSVAVGTTAADERSAGTVVDDNIIMMKIKEDLLQEDLDEMLTKIAVTVTEGRVMFTGSVSEEKYAKQAVGFAWKTNGVKEVINELVVSKKEIKDTAKDTFIANSVRSRLLLEKDLRSVNYAVEANNSVVYLLGIAQDEDERKRALKIASSVKGVRKVVNHVILKSDKRRVKSDYTESQN